MLACLTWLMIACLFRPSYPARFLGSSRLSAKDYLYFASFSRNMLVKIRDLYLDISQYLGVVFVFVYR